MEILPLAALLIVLLCAIAVSWVQERRITKRLRESQEHMQNVIDGLQAIARTVEDAKKDLRTTDTQSP